MVIYIGYHRTKGDNMRKYATVLLFILSILLCSCISAGETYETVGTGEVTHVTETESTPPDTETAPPKDTETTSRPIEIETPEEMLVTINEVCSLNGGCFKDRDGSTPDWIELYNCSDRTINLAGYGLSNDPSEPFKYTFNNYLIRSGECVLLIASGEADYKSGVIYLPFKLSSLGETLILTSPGGLSDVVDIPDMDSDETYGRTVDGGNVLSHITPSPLVTNNSAESLIRVSAPEFSHGSGFYTEDIELTISATEGCTVYYTTDGSMPTAGSPIYSGPITLSDATEKPNVISSIGGTDPENFVTEDNQDKINVIRAIAVDSDGNHSKITNATYFIMPEEAALRYENVSVLSVYTNPEYLFEYEDGIYVLGKEYDFFMENEFDESLPAYERPANYHADGKDSERAAVIDYFDEDHDFGFSQNVGIRIWGDEAARADRSKSFEIFAGSEYGKGSFDYPIFEGVEIYDSFVMKSLSSETASKMLDLTVESLISAEESDMPKQKVCAIFLNGEYWGSYILSERLDDDYFADRYGIEKDEVVMIDDGELSLGREDDAELYYELISFTRSNDMSVPENYEALLSMIDIESYIEYTCIRLIKGGCGQCDESATLWRTREADGSSPCADGKWRWVYSSCTHTSPEDSRYVGIPESDMLFNGLCQNEVFVSLLSSALAGTLEKCLDTAKIDEYIGYLGENFYAQMSMSAKRYGRADNFADILDNVREYLYSRREYVTEYVSELHTN